MKNNGHKKKLKKVKPVRHDVIFYHADADGFASATAYEYWRQLERPNSTADYIPVDYDNFEGHFKKNLKGYRNGELGNIAILDFHIPVNFFREVVLPLQPLKIFLVDHHKTSEDELEAEGKLCSQKGQNYRVEHDINHAGCVLTWKTLLPGMDITPKFLRYIEDRDLWRWKMEGSEAVNAAVEVLPYNLDEWAYYIKHPEKINQQLKVIGEYILRYQHNLVDRIVDRHNIAYIDGYKVPHVSTPVLQSEVGHALCEKYPDAPFSATTRKTKDGRVIYSLRSKPKRKAGEYERQFDVGEFAREHGGGGHTGAAGFTIDENMLDENRQGDDWETLRLDVVAAGKVNNRHPIEIVNETASLTGDLRNNPVDADLIGKIIANMLNLSHETGVDIKATIRRLLEESGG
jgi:oligoribonuclease NrnB/cAMP/cGMP phosphodiesterase (DHH superfamily)